MDKVAAELLPLKVAVMVALPEAEERELALKLALSLPWRTVTVAGTVSAWLLLDRLMSNVPAVFDTVTVQVVAVPAIRRVDLQETEEITGLDHNLKAALCEEAPSVACTEAVPSAAMSPIEAVKVALLLPAATVTLAGRVIAAEVEFRVTTVSAGAACESAAVQELVVPDITPVGLQTSPVRRAAIFRATVADWLEPL